MNGTNSTPLSTAIRMFFLVVVFFSGTITAAVAQTPSCACKSAIQVSVDQACEALITSDMILANGSTCGGTSTAVVTLMRTPTGGIIATGTGSALLTSGQLWIGKTIYGKVATAGGTNSCWTTISIEDKQKPTWEDDDPLDLVVTCPAVGTFVPVATDNCHTPKVYMVSEQITVNDCINPLFAGPDTLKLIERRFLARDESGNISQTECIVRYWVVGLDIDDIIGVRNVAVQCDDNYAKLPNGNPSPTDIKIGNTTYFGTGVPSLYPWMPAVSSAGTADVNPVNGNLRLSGGTRFGDVPGTGAQICITVPANGTIIFDWNASMKGTTPPPGNYAGDHAQYGVNGSWTNLTLGGVGSGATPQSGINVNVPVNNGDQFCFRVRTNNIDRWTELMISNLRGPIPAATPLNPGGDPHCNIFVTYEDVKFPTIKCVTKIMRKWQILEWSCDSKVKEFIQIIEILDSKGPVITGLKDDYTSTNGYTCEGRYRLQKPVLADNCALASSLTYDVTYPGGFVKGLKVTDADRFIPLPLGCNEVIYTAYDDCHNASEYDILVYVEDNTAPVAICIQNTVIGLTHDGSAYVPATSFDNGSYDDCSVAKVLVRRMDATACKPCKTPEFPGFTYLGEFTNTGDQQAPHYYYISKHKATPDVAIKTAAAMGGYVVALNTAVEDHWVYGKVREWNLREDYLIGLRDVKKKGLFAWLSGEGSKYRNWGAGNPKDTIDGNNSFDYARVLDANGKWEDFGSYRCEENEYLYVVEITDPCGFSAFTNFCCTDVRTSPHTVVFRVIDKSGNWNECMVNATVQDKLPPTIICPPHMTVTCNDLFDTGKLRHAFGWPTAYDNCDNITITTDSLVELNSCRIGKITRNFTATDPGGRTARCTQIIIVNGLDKPFEMTENRWPRDTTIVGCEDPNDEAFSPANLGRPDLSADNICSLVGADYKDQVFTFNNTSGDACFKILRHWTVIDWCQRFEITGGGFYYRTWTHTQVIKVYDPEKPVILSSCAPKTVCSYDPACSGGYIELSATATDKCTKVLRYSYKIDAFNDGSFDSGLSKSGLGNSADASGTYPIGTHKIVWTFEDLCGNLTKCDQLFTIVNCKAPTPYCINGLATSLMPVDTNGDGTADAGMVEIWAKDFDNNSTHPCPGYTVVHSFRPVTAAADGTPVIVRGRTFTCDSLGRRNVNIYVAAVDRNGNVILDNQGRVVQDFCTTFITIQDNFKVCGNNINEGRLTVNGSLMTEADIAVKDVNVALEGSEKNMITGKTGTYSFSSILNGANYVVKPRKNDDHLNGVSTLDLVMIQRHILGLDKFTSPYKLIAADINKDQKITASDLTDLRKLILGVQNEFTNNESWRFVDKTYVFQDAQNAQAESFPEVYYIENMNNDMEVNFLSIKVGDVNGNVVANANQNNVEPRSASVFALETENQAFSAGQTVSVPFKVAQQSEISGFQFTINFEPELFSLEAVDGALKGMTDYNFGFTKLGKGIVTVSYNQAAGLDLNTGDKVFTLVFKARDKGLLSEGLTIGSDITKAEAYTEDMQVMNVNFSVNNRISETTVLYQNTPNPFKSITMIGFELPESMQAKITVFDVTGKSLKVINETFNKGYNSIELNKNELGSAGVLYYTLEAGDFKATRKMVVIE